MMMVCHPFEVAVTRLDEWRMVDSGRMRTVVAVEIAAFGREFVIMRRRRGAGVVTDPASEGGEGLPW